jgi:hypothetical protein
MGKRLEDMSPAHAAMYLLSEAEADDRKARRERKKKLPVSETYNVMADMQKALVGGTDEDEN